MGPGNSIYLLTKVKQNQSMIKVISTDHVLGIWGVLGSRETKGENAIQCLFLQGSFNQLRSQTESHNHMTMASLLQQKHTQSTLRANN